MKRILVVTLALLLTAGVALAQGRGGGGNGGGMMGPGGGMMGPGAVPGLGGGPGLGFGGPGGGLLVADNGTVLLPSVVTDSATGTATAQLVAVSATGTKLWTATITNRGHLTLSGSYLLAVSQSATNTTATATVNALSLATGASAWSLTLNGHVQSLTPFSGGTYAVVVTPAATAGAAATRSLVAIGPAGAVLWKLDA